MRVCVCPCFYVQVTHKLSVSSNRSQEWKFTVGVRCRTVTRCRNACHSFGANAVRRKMNRRPCWLQGRCSNASLAPLSLPSLSFHVIFALAVILSKVESSLHTLHFPTRVHIWGTNYTAFPKTLHLTMSSLFMESKVV